MDRDLRLRVPHRRTARPADPPRQHPRDERRELSPRQQHCPKAATKVLRSDRSFWPKEANAPWHAPAIGKRARHGAGHCHLAWFCAAAWPDFAPPLTSVLQRPPNGFSLRLDETPGAGALAEGVCSYRASLRVEPRITSSPSIRWVSGSI